MDIGSNSIILKREKKNLWIAIAHCCVIINASEFETLRKGIFCIRVIFKDK